MKTPARTNGVLALSFLLSTLACAEPEKSLLDLESFIPTDTSVLMGSPDPELPPYEIENAFENLDFERPVVLTHGGDGTDRIFVCSQRGEIFVFPNRRDIGEAKTFLDIQSQVSRGGNEEGLLGLAFHPGYREKGEFFVYYSSRNPRESIISRFRVSAGDPDRADPGSEEVLLRIPQPFGNHNGGSIVFGPDGMLYIGLGDGGSRNDPQHNGQNLETLLGSVLRIDIDRKDPGKNYAVPGDNPFVDRGGKVKGEIWAFGVRNIWRLCFDRLTGELWAGDVGQNIWEEVDIITRGGNYGWNVREGKHWFEKDAPQVNDDFIDPVWEYHHSLGTSVTGGVVYRGKKLPGLEGAYVYADFDTFLIWALRKNAEGEISNHQVARSRLLVSSFGEDEKGELYFTAFDGHVYQLRKAERKPPRKKPARFPRLLSKTGLFRREGKSLEPAAGLIPYSVNVPLWSDGGEKERFLALPAGGKVQFSEKGHWQFPVGTTLVKTFSLNQKEGDLSTRRLLETRLLVLSDRGWDGYTYKYNDTRTEAMLLDTALIENYSIETSSGKSSREWYYPSRPDCGTCHTTAAGFVLGLNTRQLNLVREYEYDGGKKSSSQLELWSRLGIFAKKLPRPVEELETFPTWGSRSAPVESLARAYLDANCAFCHAPGSTGNAKIDLRHHVPLGDAFLINYRSTQGRVGGRDNRLIRPGSPENSELLIRMAATGHLRMPSVASSLVDHEAVTVVSEWIRSMPPGVEVAKSGKGRWVDLFNGEDLTGWRQINGQATFHVEDGMIVGTTVKGSPNSFLCTERLHGDFELEFEVKVDPRLNSGVQIRSNSLESYRDGRVHGYQVEISSTNAGYIYDEARRGWLSHDRSSPRARAAFKEGEWNKFRVTSKGKVIRTWVNGVPVANLKDTMTRIGFIGLQVHAFKDDPPAEVRWRNLRIRSQD